jgi:hypothetical protein
MMREYILPGTSSKQINENIKNNPNIKEGNEDYFTYPQNLYTLLLQKKDVIIEFIKPPDLNIKTYNYEWTKTFNFFFLQLFIQLSEECSKKTCPDMTAGKKLEYLCTQHGKNTKKYCAINYVSHNVNTTIAVLLNPRFYLNRFEIGDNPELAFFKWPSAFTEYCTHIFSSYESF